MIVTRPLLMRVVGISARGFGVTSFMTPRPTPTNAVERTIAASAPSISLLFRICLLRIRERDERSRGNSRYRHFVRVPSQHLDRRRRIAAMIGKVHNRFAGPRENGLRRNADGV